MLLDKGGISNFVWGPSYFKNIQMLTLKKIKKIFNNYNNFEILQKNINPAPESHYYKTLRSISTIEESEMVELLIVAFSTILRLIVDS